MTRLTGAMMVLIWSTTTVALAQPAPESPASAEADTPPGPTPSSEAVSPPAAVAPAPEAEEPTESSISVQQQPGDERASSGGAEIRVAVMDLGGAHDLDKEMIGSLTTTVATTLEKLGPFEAISSQELRQLLTYESQQQLLGCDEMSCLAEIGGALGADFLISGTLTRIGDRYVIQLQLTNIRDGKVEARVSRDYTGDRSGIFDELRGATRILVRGLLGMRSGELSVTVSEEGASVKVDGSIVGVSPMPSVTVAGGVHRIAVEKEGFIVYKQDIEVFEGRPTTVPVRLVPSADYIEHYQREAGFTRMMSWIGIGIGAAGVIGTGVFLAAASVEQSHLNDDTLAYNARSNRSTADYDALARRETGIAIMDGAMFVAAGIGLVGVAAGIILRVTGGDPDRYRGFRKATSGPSGTSVSFTLNPTGATLVARF